MKKNILSRTKEILSNELMEKISKTKFCVVGCGAVGSTFSEMLVRTGAENITIIDGDKIENTNLNRGFSFLEKDVGKKKVDVLENRLVSIRKEVIVKKSAFHFKENDPDSSNETQATRDLVFNSEMVINVPDNNRARYSCQKLCQDSGSKTLFIGVRIKKDFSEYECAWNPKPLSEDKLDDEGYGHGSYMAIVMEATSVGFMMLLHHLKNPESNDFVEYYKKYKNYLPICCQ